MTERIVIARVVALCLLGALAHAGDEPPRVGPIRLPVVRDTWLSNVGAEADGGNGGSARLKLKSIQELSLIDVDAATLRGRTVRSARLFLRSTGEPRLKRVTVSGIGAPWTEGTASGYAPQTGSSTHNHRAHPELPWTNDGGDLCRVILGQGGTVWRMADASPPDANGWQSVPVDPVVVSARVAGISHGFILFDDTGSEWSRDGERFTRTLFPNRYVFSRDSGRESAPYLVVEPGPDDRAPPGAPTDIRGEAAGLPPGEARLSWITPQDNGPAGTVGFFVRAGDREVPRYLIPVARRPGESVTMHLRDMGLAPGTAVAVTVRAVDGAGNLGPEATARIDLPKARPFELPGRSPAVEVSDAGLPSLGMGRVAVLDELDKIDPRTGDLLPSQPEGYRASNHLWSAARRQIHLQGGRNEFLAFQVEIQGITERVTPTSRFEGEALPVTFGRYVPVPTTHGPMADPIVPLGGGALEGGQNLHVELFVPHTAKAGRHAGALTLESGGARLELAIEVQVGDFTLPDSLSFLPEMNCYGLPDDERSYYRLAHVHRTVLNRVPYGQNGSVQDGCAPTWDGAKLEWAAWDRRFGPLFDGTAFADLPRKGVPIEVFYLPLQENWPTPIEGAYNGDYWADQAFPGPYRAAFVAASRQFAEHASNRNWDRTLFQCFFNGKNDFKQNGWSRASSPWLLDEPANWQDFWALRWFGAAFHEGVRAAGRGPAHLLFRADISRPEWQREALDGLLDYAVIGGSFHRYHRLVLDRKLATGQIVLEYGSTNPVEGPNLQPVGWCLDVWSLGGDGVIPWQTVGNAASWRKADTLALFYPGQDGGPTVPSVRLKAYRRGQQDVEYLTLLAKATGQPHWAVGQAVRELLPLAGQRRDSATGAVEDAGRIDYDRLRPQDLWALRARVGQALSELHPAPSRKLRDWSTPPRDPTLLTPGHADGG